MYVNIVLFDDFETLDAFGPAEVFGNLPEEFHVRYLSVSGDVINSCLLYTSPSPRDRTRSRMPSSA